MSSQLFDAQLLVPDNHASNQQLFDLIAADTFTGPGLPDVAHRYLDAFCNKSYSSGRRRWIGIALVGMMRASSNVIQRLKQLSRGTSQLGATILDCKETEVCRIVAGLIIRQGLEAGIDFEEFWASSKLPDSAPNFPKESSDLWLSQLQKYVDTLSDLLLADLNSEAVVVYPIALSFKDGFHWAGRSAITLVENNVLTMIVSDFELSKFHFIDIPVYHITETSLQQDSPHESQEGRSGHKMHTLMMRLRRSSPNYQLDTSDHTTSDLRVSFACLEDANHFRIGLDDARRTLGTAATNEAKAPGPMRLHKDNNVGYSDIGSIKLSDEAAPSEELRQKERPTQRSGEENGRGKLPSVSKATKQNAVRAQQLPSGAPKGTKARAAKNAAPIIETSEDEDESEESSQDEYGLHPEAQSLSSGTVRKSQSRRRTSADDDDFVPIKAKSTSSKRKRASVDAAEQNRATKKRTQTRSNNATESPAARATTKKQKVLGQRLAQSIPKRAREPMMHPSAQQNLQKEAFGQHSLIGGLLNSKSPSKTASPTFKKPGQPASTPGRPRTKLVRTTPKPQTPHDTRKVSEDLPACVSSTPRSQLIHEDDFGVDYTPVDAEILSSNTKRVPDSPHAESTAISGHADQDDVHREKRRGDLETAKSDPFQGQEGQRMTTFTRKLTAEGSVEDGAGHEDHLPLPVESLNDGFEVDDSRAMPTSQPLLKHSPSSFKHRTQSYLRPSAHAIGYGDPSTHTAKPHNIDTTTLTDTSQSLKFQPLRASQNKTRPPRQATPMDRSRSVTVPATPKEHRTAAAPLNDLGESHVHLLSAPEEAIEDTLLDAQQQEAHEVGPDGETTLIGEDDDMPEQYRVKSRDLRFRSSPPIPDSSSIRDASSDESQPEPELSPPTSRADELEWEDALQPHQRDLHEQLLRTSTRVMRHIVDNETAVTDIADIFANDGERLLNLMLERQNKESAEAFQNLANKKQDLLKEFSDTSKNLKQQRKRLRASE